MRAIAVAILFSAGPLECGTEPGSYNTLGKYLFQWEREER